MEGTVHLTHGLALSWEKYAKVFGSSMMSMKTQMCVQKKWRGPKEVHRIYFDPCQLNTVRTLLSHWFLLNNLFNLFNWRLKKGAFTQSIAYLGTWSLRRVLGQLVKRSKLRVPPSLPQEKRRLLSLLKVRKVTWTIRTHKTNYVPS